MPEWVHSIRNYTTVFEIFAKHRAPLVLNLDVSTLVKIVIDVSFAGMEKNIRLIKWANRGQNRKNRDNLSGTIHIYPVE